MNSNIKIWYLFFVYSFGLQQVSLGQWKCGHCAPRARVEPVDFGYPYGQDWDYGVYIEVPKPYRDQQGRMFTFGWHR